MRLLRQLRLWRRRWKRGDTLTLCYTQMVNLRRNHWREGDCERPSASDSAKARSALQSSEPGVSRSVHSSLPWNLCGKQVGSGGGNRLSLSAETSRDCVVGPSRCLADDQVQHWTRWLLSFQEDLRQAI